jgi:flagellar basal-body rod modification protein FlgD
MDIDPINTMNPMGERQVGRKQLSQDDFMRIFLKQMNSQSPLKPYDSAAMMQQMAEFTSLSASEDLKNTISKLNVNLNKSQAIAGSDLIGKQVSLLSDYSPLVKDQGLHGSVMLTQPATDVTVQIKDANNQVIKTVKLGSSGQGVTDFSWDGVGDNNQVYQPDNYHISATATVDGKQVDVYTAGQYKVNSVTWNRSNGAVILNVDGIGGVDMDELVKILS